ncbi:MAG: MOSC domain-containing protein [Proteobacteria bacterium]|nr:MOSC domain-containing protein [Pseudomonadota bacterium]
MEGSVKDILTAEKSGIDLQSNTSVELFAGKGIVGDRYYSAQGTFSQALEGEPDFEITLIEQEQIDAFNQQTGFNYAAADFRRNIVTTGIDLNELEGKEFTVGNVRLKGIRLCEPCAYLSSLLGPEVLEHMLHKAGLRAQILTDGILHVSDKVMSL